MLLRDFKTYLNNKSYNINLTKNNLYINNYKKIDNINETNITIVLEDCMLKAEGTNIKVSKLLDKEILFNGQIESIKIINNDRN